MRRQILSVMRRLTEFIMVFGLPLKPSELFNDSLNLIWKLFGGSVLEADFHLSIMKMGKKPTGTVLFGRTVLHLQRSPSTKVGFWPKPEEKLTKSERWFFKEVLVSW